VSWWEGDLRMKKCSNKVYHGLLRVLLVAVMLCIIGFNPVILVFADGPHTVDTSLGSDYDSNNIQHLNFYAKNLHWVFYINADYSFVVYKTSEDATTWSDAITVTNLEVAYFDFDVYSNGNDVVYAISKVTGSTYSIYTRKGTLSIDGTITWADDEQLVYNTVGGNKEVSVALDTDGYTWVSWERTVATVYTSKTSTNDGTWTTADGFPYETISTSDSYGTFTIPLTSGKMAIVGSTGYTSQKKMRIRTWNGASWNNMVETTNTSHDWDHCGATAVGDDVYFVFGHLATTMEAYFAIYTYASNSITTESKIFTWTGTTSSHPKSLCMGRDNITNDFYLFWNNDPDNNHIYYLKYTFATSTWDANATDLVTENAVYYVTASQPISDVVGIKYRINGSTGYDQIYYYLGGTPTSPPDPPTNVSATSNLTDRVTITWTKSVGATNYHVWRGTTDLGDAGDVATFDDTPALGCATPTITVGTATASNGSSTSEVTLVLNSSSVSDGTQYTYTVVASNEVGSSSASAGDIGWITFGAVSYQWYRSSGTSDSDFSELSGATDYSDTDTTASVPTITAGATSASDGTYNVVRLTLNGTAFNNGVLKSYYCTVSAVGASSVSSNHDAGWIGIGTPTYQWQKSDADSDADYNTDISGATTSTYDYSGVANLAKFYYRCKLTATGVASASYSSGNEGWLDSDSPSPISSSTSQLAWLIPLIMVVFVVGVVLKMANDKGDTLDQSDGNRSIVVIVVIAVIIIIAVALVVASSGGLTGL
jgi:hypothetical protein